LRNINYRKAFMSRRSAEFLSGTGEGAKVLLGGLALQSKVIAEQTGGLVSITAMTLDPHRLVPPHVHEGEDEYTYVVAGRIDVRLGDEEFEAADHIYVTRAQAVASDIAGLPDATRSVPLLEEIARQ
jgi:mannose-6-phosphate isomerase-like protein (cupin superfamily)